MAKTIDYEKAFDEAFAAAKNATNDYLKKHPKEWYPCGFSWVVFEGRDPAVNFLKKNKEKYGRLAGDKGYPKGWHIWDPSNSATQCMEAKNAGSSAFCSVMAKHGIKCHYSSRMD